MPRSSDGCPLWSKGISADLSGIMARGEPRSSKAEISERCLARGRASYWVRESVTDLLCERS